jgi:hypothetical protein
VSQELVVEAADALERVGCQFQFCDGPTLEPVDGVTCFRCDLLARLRAAVGRPARRPDEETFRERDDRRHAQFVAEATRRAPFQRPDWSIP